MITRTIVRVANAALGRMRPAGATIAPQDMVTTLGWYARKGLAPFARGVLWRLRLAHASGPCFVGRGVSVAYPRHLTMKPWSSIGSGSIINALSDEGVLLGRGVTIRENAWIQCSSNPHERGVGLRVGDGTYVGPGAIIGVGGLVDIGPGCQIGASAVLIAENHAVDQAGVVSSTSVERKGIRIGAGSWIGHRVTVVDGVVLGERCIVGAGAVVTRSFPAGTRLAGVPARPIGAEAAR